MRSLITTTLVALTLATLGCRDEAAERPRTPGQSTVPEDGREAVPATPTEYSTTVLFVGGEARRSPGAVLRFSNLASAQGLSRTYRGWVFGRGGWRLALDESYREEPVRAPWRLFPGDSIQLVVGGDGDSEALVFRVRGSASRLELGDRLDGWEDRAGTRHEIRAAELVRGGRASAGVVLQQRFTVAAPRRPTRFGPYERAVLISEEGAVIVLFHTTEPGTYGDPFAWMHADGLTRRWSVMETRTVEVVNSPSLRRNVPIRFWFRIPEPDIRCELTAGAREIVKGSAERGPVPYNALYRVRGWFEFSGERRNVEGILERGEA